MSHLYSDTHLLLQVFAPVDVLQVFFSFTTGLIDVSHHRHLRNSCRIKDAEFR